MKKRGIAWILTTVLILTMGVHISVPARAAEENASDSSFVSGDTNGDGVITVYFTLSEDGEFVRGNDENETQMVHVPMDMTYFDLADYGLEKFYRYESDTFENGGGYINEKLVEEPTLLHLYIRMLEKYYLGNGSKLVVGDKEQDALSISGSAQSLYMTRFWGHDENLMYFVDHKYPLQATGWGSTSDYILLKDGMEIDVAMFSDWDFYHNGAFAQFVSAQDKVDGKYEVEQNASITFQMQGTSTNAAYGGESAFANVPMPGETVVCEKQENAVSENTNAYWKSVGKTDEDGNVTLKFSQPGTYYISSTPLYENYKMDSGNACVAPPIAVVEVKEGKPEEPGEQTDYTGTLIQDISFAEGTVKDSEKYELSGDFSADQNEYDIYVPDYKKDLSVFVEPSEAAPERTSYQVSYTDTEGNEKNIEIQPGEDVGKKLNNLLKTGTSGGDFILRAVCENTVSEDVEETFHFHVVRRATLRNLSIELPEGESFEENLDFSPGQFQYQMTLPVGATEGFVLPVPFGEEGYTIESDGNVLDENGKLSFSFTEEENEKSCTVKVCAENCLESTYLLKLCKRAGVSVVFSVTKGSSLQVTDTKKRTVCRHLCTESEYILDHLSEGEEYYYTATCNGYQAESGSFVARKQQTVDVCLAEAQENTSIKKEIPALWKNFRGNNENNGLTEALTPTDFRNAQLYWANKVGENYGKGAPSSPIIVDDALIYTTATSIVKVDKVTGEILASGEMVRASAFNITPPAYGDGMIFVALASGTIQAFNADTLESLWVYHDPYYGQPNSPITYYNGYLYTGFWSGDSNKANFVCLSVTDEDIENRTEEKTATWTYTKAGGFYWAGCYVNDDFVLVGTDDGCKEEEDGNASLIAFSPLTGEILDQRTNLNGDVRSTICYDKVTDRYYFTSKGGSFYAASVKNNGTISDLQELKLSGASTSTPVVYNGRAYVGVKGKEQFGVNAGHNITVIDLAEMKVAYKLTTRGYPQTSGLLTTGYEEDDGYIYVYFVDNYEPGKIRVLKDKAGQTEAIITRESEYEESDDTNVLFSPKGEQANYAICSLICDENGTFYFKNDSAYMMALGSKITKIKVTDQPEKRHYREGEKFDPSGMKVIAYYANGTCRDVTKYVTYTQKELTLDMVDVEICFPYASYNDELENYESFDPLIDAVDITVVDEKGLTAAEHAVAAIEQIKTPVTLDSGKEIQEARKTYDNLESSQENYVINYEKLVQAENTYADVLKTYWKTCNPVVKVESDTYQSLKLSWGKITGAEGYELYRATSERGKYQKISYVSGTEYKDTGLQTGTEYFYKIIPCAKLGPWGKMVVTGESSNPVHGKTVLSAAVLTSVKKKGYDSLEISWKKVTGADGYVIYRSTSKTGTYKKIKTVVSKGTVHYVNSGLKTGTSYYYKVCAYRKSGSQTVYGAFSKVKSEKPTLASVSVKKVKAGKKQAVLSWKKLSGANGYEIVRSTKKSKGYKKVKTITSAATVKYTDKKLKSNQIYYYKVRGYRKVNGKKVYSPYSTPKKVKVK